MTEQVQGRYERMLFALGGLCGALFDEEVRAALIESLRAERLNAEYVTLVRDYLNQVLAESQATPDCDTIFP